MNPACVKTRLLLQVLADHIPGMGQELHLNITGTKLPQQALSERTQIDWFLGEEVQMASTGEGSIQFNFYVNMANSQHKLSHDT